MALPPSPQTGAMSFGKNLLLLAMVCVAGVILYKFLFSEGSGLLGSPVAVDLKYSDADFKFNLDEESTLRILANPEKYEREFGELIYNFNMALLYHTANRMNLADSARRQLEPLYKRQHEYLKSLYYADFVALKDTTDNLYRTWYNDNANSAVKLFQEVAGKYTCFFVTQIIATALKTSTGRLMAKGKNVASPCDIALNEALKPMVDRLAVKAAIYDFSASKGLLKEKISRDIAELATYEQQDRKGINKNLEYKILGFSVSETDVEVTAISVIKAGFKLDQYFDIGVNSKKNLVIVTLPQPRILSHEVYPKVDKIDVGWFAGIKGDDMNKMFESLRREFREEAEADGIYSKSKKKAESLMQDLLGPVVRQMGKNWKIAVTYQNDGSPDEPSENVGAQPDSRSKTTDEPAKKQPAKAKKKDEFVPPF